MLPVKAPEKHLTIPETAGILGVKPKTVRVWIAKRYLGSARFGRAVRVPVSELSRLIEESTIPARQG